MGALQQCRLTAAFLWSDLYTGERLSELQGDVIGHVFEQQSARQVWRCLAQGVEKDRIEGGADTASGEAMASIERR